MLIQERWFAPCSWSPEADYHIWGITCHCTSIIKKKSEIDGASWAEDFIFTLKKVLCILFLYFSVLWRDREKTHYSTWSGSWKKIIKWSDRLQMRKSIQRMENLMIIKGEEKVQQREGKVIHIERTRKWKLNSLSKKVSRKKKKKQSQ